MKSAEFLAAVVVVAFVSACIVVLNCLNVYLSPFAWWPF